MEKNIENLLFKLLEVSSLAKEKDYIDTTKNYLRLSSGKNPIRVEISPSKESIENIRINIKLLNHPVGFQDNWITVPGKSIKNFIETTHQILEAEKNQVYIEEFGVSQIKELRTNIMNILSNKENSLFQITQIDEGDEEITVNIEDKAGIVSLINIIKTQDTNALFPFEVNFIGVISNAENRLKTVQLSFYIANEDVEKYPLMKSRIKRDKTKDEYLNKIISQTDSVVINSFKLSTQLTEKPNTKNTKKI